MDFRKMVYKKKKPVNGCPARAYNGMIVPCHFRPNRKFLSYNAVDGTIRVGRIGKPFRVQPMPVAYPGRPTRVAIPVICV